MPAIGSQVGQRLELPLSARLLEKGSPGRTAVDNGQPATFADFLTSGVNQVNSMQQDANAKVHEMLTGGDVSQVEVLTAVQKSDMAFRMLVQVRNKLMAAYEEINAIRI